MYVLGDRSSFFFESKKNLFFVWNGARHNKYRFFPLPVKKKNSKIFEKQEEMDDDFQFVDLDSNDSVKELEQLRKEVQKLKGQCLSEQRSDVMKKLQKEWEECRQSMSSMVSELKQMEEDKKKLQQGMRALEAKHVETQSQLVSLREEVKTLKNAEKKWTSYTTAVSPSSSSSSTAATATATTAATTAVSITTTAATAITAAITTSLSTAAAALTKMKDDGIDDSDGGEDNKTKGTTKSKSNWKELDSSQCYACKECGTHIGLDSDVLNRSYQVGQGAFSEKTRGYLFSNAVNLIFGPTKTENFTSGSYDISNVTCAKCGLSMGWKYLTASNDNNNTKVGKFCLARYNLTSPQERNAK
ncbi:fad NAD binding oxidoreductase [Reticulomyxa filosa]|uniref:Fad NAD binding oxidoreductase n=1 Tax=Reticulomyxa filosa TaxID=46433 RepID=X6MJ41_RETFI|nr:fad NAD binding oxidoreductase [Reticulomyxa filosa]|eukprot:ETO14033.1 fad NAD binding oxidoreductase [Reticulomyxa filosa]